jgi:predicted metal-dependent phosphotriesterase family hydrolase
MEPHLRSAMAAGVRSFVDCSPMYLARDPERFIPLMREFGVSDASIFAMTVTNPARACRIYPA